jgi:diaminohydroxyphosphoribosylaminopyrimidine deaminase/5-amino-6-(5-phosphoribosylamino)uracil reductase
MVGCVLVKGGRIIGEGYHRRFGGPHAEINALRDAQAAGRKPRGATAYVTLEPCSHTGKTGPCADALIAAGIKRVVIGTLDPHPTSTGGAQRLRAAGVDLAVGCLKNKPGN